ncbi:serine hydrolase domain-containing protein (plasmid) [Sphingobium sp. V4]|uniref:serine hydrolase domain-containing protein n=1 Tax=Sphingobium sp. V4 TaxID=3038927 RepID=UPI002557D242|nr:serine hydrolase domain-containing protein [Sphingobium sp. V4]WIW90327.1 serine hydrolase domain-containing protein [Sphingobium sp. V4]
MAALDALFAPFDRTDAPGFAVGVALGGKPGYRRGFGMASIELPVALSPSIRMRIGSTSKHFCVLAAMLLCEEGKLDLDASPRTYLPELPEWAAPMTVRQLMAHTSGMRDSLDLLLQSAGPGIAVSGDFQLKLLAGLDSVNAPAGHIWNYNNGGYVLLTEIIERLSGQGFADFLQARILQPLGMHDTLLRPLDTALLPNSATLHLPRPDGGWSRGVFGAPIGGEGGIVSTVDDMLRWLNHMSDPIVGTQETWQEMRTPLTTHGYGLGLNMTAHRGLATVHHAGGVIGGSSQMLKVLEHDLDIIIMTNGRSALDLYGLVDAIIDRCIPDLPPLEEDVGGQVHDGTFYSSATGQVYSLVGIGDQQAISVAGMTLPAKRLADGTMSIAILPSDLRLRLVDDGGAPGLEAVEFGHTDRLSLVHASAAGDPSALQGIFVARSAGLSANIYEDDQSSWRVDLRGPAGGTHYHLHPLGPKLWKITPPEPGSTGGTLEIVEDGFLLTTGRTVRLHFARQDLS